MKRSVIKCQKQNNQRQKHLNSILAQVKNRFVIEGLCSLTTRDPTSKFNWREIANNALFNLKSLQSLRAPLRKPSQKVNQFDLTHLLKENNFGKSQTYQLDSNIISEIPSERAPRKLTKRVRRNGQDCSSRLQMQLSQIMQYANLFPSRQTNYASLQKKISKIDCFFNKKQPFKQKDMNPNQSKSQNKNEDKYFIKKRSRRQRQTTTSLKGKLLEQSIILDLVEKEGSEIINFEEQKLKLKQTKDLVKKLKNNAVQIPVPFDYSLTSFIQKDIKNLKLKSGRRTTGTLSQNIVSNQISDIRYENIYNIHRFLRGEAHENEQLTNYLTVKQMQKYQQKFDLYDSMYRKTKQEFQNEKFDLNTIKDLTLKNAIFLNQALKQNNNWNRKQEICSKMKDLNFFQ